MNSLSVTLRRLFDGGDQLLWGLADSTAMVREGERLTRVDPEHEVIRPAEGVSPTAPPALQSPMAESWLVIVESAENFLAAGRIEHLRTLLGDHPRTLLIALDPENDGSPHPREPRPTDRALVDLSVAIGFDHLALIAGNDLGRVIEGLADVKRRDRATLVHLKEWDANAVDALLPAVNPAEVAAPDSETAPARSLQQRASAELARLAVRDARITVAVARGEGNLLLPWSNLPDRVVRSDSSAALLLQWLAALALEGGRPFVFLSLQELLGGFGQLLQDICMKRAAVTLIVRPHDRSHDDEVISSAGLAGFRQLPHLSVISPKDGVELGQALEWCATQDDPALVWLPQQAEPGFTWNTTSPFERGRIETLGTGNHATIIAWGPMVAAASLAAQCLAEYGIECTVVNCRFAQPLDREGISLATRNTLITIVLDDLDEEGGFSSWILDHLTRIGMARPVTVIAANPRTYPQDRHDSHQQCAMRIVEHCRWLAEPLASSSGVTVTPLAPVEAASEAEPGVWTSPVYLPAVPQHDEQGQVLAQQFSPFIDHWVRGYSETGERDLYLWRWCLHGLELTTLSCVAAELRRELCDTKLLAVMYGVMLDDVADQGGQEAFLEELTKIISGVQPLDVARFSDAQRDYARFTRQLWDAFEERLRSYPAYEEYESLLAYDHRQILNTMTYSCMVNRHLELLNVQEHDMVLPHNMQMMSFATMDLMCSPTFDRRELGALREVVWHAQSMGRIGNLVSTWQREIKDRDFTSGVFARAIREGDLSADELRSASAETIERAIRNGGHEAYFLRKWESHRRCIQASAGRIRSVDVAALLAGLQRLIYMELGSRGLK